MGRGCNPFTLQRGGGILPVEDVPFKREEAYSGWRVYNLRPFKGEEAYSG